MWHLSFVLECSALFRPFGHSGRAMTPHPTINLITAGAVKTNNNTHTCQTHPVKYGFFTHGLTSSPARHTDTHTYTQTLKLLLCNKSKHTHTSMRHPRSYNSADEFSPGDSYRCEQIQVCHGAHADGHYQPMIFSRWRHTCWTEKHIWQIKNVFRTRISLVFQR